jgi:putative transposase
VYHVLNRANARRRIFEKDADYSAFENTLAEVQERIPMRILTWCLMPNHWHLVLWPIRDGDLSDYMRLVSLTHTQRWHAHRATAGSGHLYPRNGRGAACGAPAVRIPATSRRASTSGRSLGRASGFPG